MVLMKGWRLVAACMGNVGGSALLGHGKPSMGRPFGQVVSCQGHWAGLENPYWAFLGWLETVIERALIVQLQ